MLTKLSEPQITNDAPFANDVLDRGRPIQRLSQLIKSTKQPFVLSIEAPWGWGKTTFVRMWKAYLESQGHICFLFNAWQNDFVEDPLVAFVGDITRLIEKEKNELNNNHHARQYLDALKKFGVGILKRTLPLAVQLVSHGILNQETVKTTMGELALETDKIEDFAFDLAKERLNRYNLELESLDAFRNNLEKLVDTIVTEKGVGPVVFFVDELDRCRPDFAIALLERIKHLFNVRNVVFVLAVDRGQLNESVKALYGLQTNSDGYLRRFIDLAFKLPAPTTEQFVENLYRRFAMDEYFSKIHDGSNHATNWKIAFTQCAAAFNLSLRTQEQCFAEMNIALRTAENPDWMITAPLAFFSALRAYQPGMFQEIRTGQVLISTATELLSKVKNEWCRVWFEAALIFAFCDKAEDRVNMLQSLQDRLRTKEQRQYYTPNNPRELASNLAQDSFRPQFLYTLSMLEMSEQFQQYR